MARKTRFFALTMFACAAGVFGVGVVAPKFDAPTFGVEPVLLAPIAFEPATLTVIGPNGEKTFDAAALEALGTHRLTTTTPWRDARTTFDGALLTDLLAATGLERAAAIRVVAENEYAVEIDRSVWTDRPLLIATRVDDAPHVRRYRGPLQFVFPMDADPSTAAETFEQNWVWMAARIEPIE